MSIYGVVKKCNCTCGASPQPIPCSVERRDTMLCNVSSAPTVPLMPSGRPMYSPDYKYDHVCMSPVVSTMDRVGPSPNPEACYYRSQGAYSPNYYLNK